MLLSLPVLAGVKKHCVNNIPNINRNNSSKINNKSDKYSTISKDQHEIIIGLTLGDLHLRKRLLNSNTSLNFKGSVKHEAYFLHLYSLFKPFCRTGPKTVVAKLGDKTHYFVKFDTLTNKVFNYYHDLFYINKVKRVPNNIGELLTAQGYWAMDDGSADRSGFILHTNSFSKEEVELLIRVLKDKFDLNCSIHTRKNMVKTPYMIYIKADSFIKFVELVSPYFHPSMKYKLERRKNYQGRVSD